MSRRACQYVLLAVVLTSVVVLAQAPKLEPGNDHPAIPTVTFTFDWPANPPHYSIAVDSAGRAAYTAVDDKDDNGDPYIVKFTASQPTRERIFAAAAALNYFQGQFDFTRHRIAFTGSKTLTYADPTRHFQTTFNWSENAQVMDLAHLFQSIANTLEGGRKLQFLRRFDRLGLNDQLKAMEDEAKDHYLVEVHVIEPVLRQIADDPAIMDLARQRARRLLRLAAAENAASSAAQ